MARGLHIALQILLVTVMVLQGWTFLQGSITRLLYPYDLEWMEGGMLVQALRYRQHLPVYTPPSADWIPCIYPPLCSWLLSLFGEPSYLLGRAVSLAAFFAACAAGFWGLRKEGLRTITALASVGLFLSCYDDSGCFFDLVRSDSLALAFAAWSLVLTRQGTRVSLTLGGVFLFVAFAAKHNYALLGIPMSLWLWTTHESPLERPKRILHFWLASIAPALLYLALMQRSTDGLFLVYLLEVPSAHSILLSRALTAQLELVQSLIWTTAAALLVGIFFIKRTGRGPGLYWLLSFMTIWLMCTLMRSHEGGFRNVMMPGYWILGFGSLFLLGKVQTTWRHPLLPSLVSLLLLVQVVTGHSWGNQEMIPTQADREAGAKLVQQIRDVEGSVFAPEFPWYPHLAGKEPSFPLIALLDVDREGGPFPHSGKAIDEAVALQRWDAILLSDLGMGYGIREHYIRGRPTRLPEKTFFTRTGWSVRPEYFWFPKKP